MDIVEPVDCTLGARDVDLAQNVGYGDDANRCFKERNKKMGNLPALKRQLNSWNGNAQTVKAGESGAPVLPVTTPVEHGLVLLDPTETGTKAKDLKEKTSSPPHRAGRGNP